MALRPKVVDGDLRMWLSGPGASMTASCSTTAARRTCAFRRAGVARQPQLGDVLPQPDARRGSPPPTWRRRPRRLGVASALAQLRAGTTAGFTRSRRSRSCREASYVGQLERSRSGSTAAQTAISGGVWHADRPSIVWFWPIIVLLACVLAPRAPAADLDARLARALGLTSFSPSQSRALGTSCTGTRRSRSPSTSSSPDPRVRRVGPAAVLLRQPGILHLLPHLARRAVAGAEPASTSARRLRPARPARGRRPDRTMLCLGWAPRPAARLPSR